MTTKIVWWTMVLSFIGYLAHSDFQEDNVCYETVSYQELREVPYQELYTERCWFIFTCEGLRTNYITEFYTTFRIQEIPCPNDETKNETSQRELSSYNCSLAVCVDSLICDCGNAHGECQGLCSDNKATSGTWIMCPWGHKHVESNQKCVPRCTDECTNGWCKRPYRDCTCFDGYWKNGSECLPVSIACVHGEQTSATECRCDYGWDGDFCDEPLLCVIAEFNGKEVASGTSVISAPHSVVTTSEDSEDEWKFPACDQTCPVELRIKAVNSSQSLTDIVYHLIPIDLQCNETEADELSFSNSTSNKVLGVLIGALLIDFIVAILVIIACKTRRRKYKIKDASVPETNDTGKLQFETPKPKFFSSLSNEVTKSNTHTSPNYE
ncbi:uncharacterized protein LOC124179970 [Neodiprion fabricii]|uniref:uncharacterized protein LOC124179970 n=1 Tax=Neodiprion fabricii TaxID=2872261 RepID=UPI001ED90E02|nr:uncharacterized protein LOC124179970 [Neodiprion fabricii]